MYTFTEYGQKSTFIPHTHNLTTESSTVFQSLSHYFNTSQEEKGRPKTLHYKNTTISCINAEDINTIPRMIMSQLLCCRSNPSKNCIHLNHNERFIRTSGMFELRHIDISTCLSRKYKLKICKHQTNTFISSCRSLSHLLMH